MPRLRSSTESALLTGGVLRGLSGAVAAGSAAGALLVVQCFLLGHAVDDVLVAGAGLASLWTAAMWLAGVSAARAALLWVSDVFGSQAAARAKSRLRRDAVAGTVRRGPGVGGGERSGDVVQTLSGGLDSLDAYVARFLPQAALSLVVPALILAAVAGLDPLSAAVLAVTGPLMPVFMWLIGSTARARARAQFVTMARLSSRFLDAIRSLATLNVFGAADAEAATLEAQGRRFRDVTMEVLKIAFLSALILELLATIGVAIVAVEIGLRLLYGRIVFRDAFVVLILAPEFYRPLRTLGAAFHAGLAGRETLERVVALAGPEVSPGEHVPGVAGLRSPAVSPRGGAASSGPPRVALTNVTFAYRPEAPPAIRDLSLDVPPGTTLALVGPTGSGKSTAVLVLLGFLSPQAGCVEVDGYPITGKTLALWRRRVAWVPQQPHLFHGSVLENLQLARPDATESDIFAALERARAAAFVRELPRGLDTPLGDRGERLSSGQAQRLAIARAFLKDAPVLVLDEPTAFLDPDNEAQTSEAVNELRAGRTVLLVAHRLSTVATADRIAVLSHGTVVESGTHAGLLAGSGLYAGMVAASGRTP